MDTDVGRVGKPTGLSQAEPEEVSALTGFDPSRMLELLADLECALVMTREHSPSLTVGSFVDSSIQFKRLADFLHSMQHAAIAIETRRAETENTGSVAQR